MWIVLSGMCPGCMVSTEGRCVFIPLFFFFSYSKAYLYLVGGKILAVCILFIMR